MSAVPKRQADSSSFSIRPWFVAAATLIAATALGCAACAKAGTQSQEPPKAGPAAAEKGSTEGIQIAPPIKGELDLRTAIVQVAKQNIPAVVHIEVTERQEVDNPFSQFESDPFFRRFFGIPQGPKKFKREQRGLGTGMIIDTEGHILTNNHVVGGATKIQILLASGEEYPGKLVGTDPKTDLAVVKIAARAPLPHVVFGDSDKVDVGEWVVAIGHPRGLDQTVTQGIISAKHRRGITDPTGYEDFLQTDAAINPGNSGGPLINLHGQVVGVNAAIASQSGGYEGIGFAIPSNMAIHVARQLMSRGKVERGWLGVTVQDLSPDLVRSMGLENNVGALIGDVMAGGPAERGGLKRGDVVLRFNGRQVTDSGTLRNLAASTPIGQDVSLSVLRKGKKLELTVKVGDIQQANKFLAAEVKERLGATVRPVTPKEIEKYGLDSGQGVAIASLEPKSSLAAAGLEVEDLILEVNGQPVEGVDSFVEAVRGLKAGQRATLLVADHRTGNTGYAKIAVR